MVLLTECEDWRQAITDALHNTFNLEDEANVIRMAARARNYTLIDGNLTRKGWYNHCSNAYHKAKEGSSYKKYT
jgi:hypothetical protein